MFAKRFSFGLLFGLLLLILSAQQAGAPLKTSWKTLEDVVFDKKWNADEGMYVLYPKFGESVRAIEGKTITITGYVIPIDYSGNIYVLSANPYSSCFFCGGAGPESVMSLKFSKKGKRFRTDERVTFTGVLRLNAHDVYELNYILLDAEPLD